MPVRTTTIVRRSAERQFLDDTLGLGPLDTHALPLTTEKLKAAARDSGDPFEVDARFSPLASDGGVGARDLKRFLGNIDESAIRETRDQGLIAEYEQANAEGIVHLAGTDYQARVRKDGAGWLAEVDVDGDIRTVRGESREHVMDRLVRLCQRLTSEQRKYRTRDLTQEELLEVARAAQSGDAQSAIARYLWFAFDKSDDVDAVAILHDPKYQPLCDQAVSYVWTCWRNDFSPSPSRTQFLRDYVGNRPVTLGLLDAAWAECRREEARAANAPEPMPEPVTVELDDLSDEQIQAEYRAAMRARARS